MGNHLRHLNAGDEVVVGVRRREMGAQAPAVIEKAGKLFLPQPLSSLDEYSLKVGVEKRMGRCEMAGAAAAISRSKAASKGMSAKASMAGRGSPQPLRPLLFMRFF